MDEVTRNGNDYVMTIIPGIRFTFSRLNESKEDLIGMLNVQTVDYPGRNDSELFEGRVILTGPRSKGDVVRDCAKMVQEIPPDEWHKIVNRVCQLVRRAYALGTPFLDLAEGEIEARPPSICAPLWHDREHAMLFGDGGSGKSTVALACATLMTTGTPGWGFTPLGPPQRIGYVDFEDDISNFLSNLALIAVGLGLSERPHIFYKRGETSLTTMVDGLSRQCAELKLDGLIFDHVGIACVGEPESAMAANDYFRSLRQLPIKWSINIAHQPKGKERADTPFGSVFWRNNARNLWQVVSEHTEEGGAELMIGLINRKANNAPLHANIALHISRQADRIVITPNDYRKAAVSSTILRDKASARDRITAYFEVVGITKSLTAKEIIEATGITRNAFDQLIYRDGGRTFCKQGEGYKLVDASLLLPPPAQNGHLTVGADDLTVDPRQIRFTHESPGRA